jgi:hypothetical protein
MNYEEKIRSLNYKAVFAKNELLTSDFNLFDNGDLKIYYAPVDYVNSEAKVIIVGITPGWTQMQKSFNVVKVVLSQGGSWEAALREVKKEASFAGTMRINLIDMLDGIGLNEKLSISSCSELYAAKNTWIHSTSFLKYPVFYREQNYRGSLPSPLSPPLWNFVENYFIEEINQFQNALIIPLGQSVKSVISKLSGEGRLKGDHVYLENFPHPSGANGHRPSQYKSNRDFLAQQVTCWKL